MSIQKSPMSELQSDPGSETKEIYNDFNCDNDRIIWTAPSNEANIEDAGSSGVSECLFSSIRLVLKGIVNQLFLFIIV